MRGSSKFEVRSSKQIRKANRGKTAETRRARRKDASRHAERNVRVTRFMESLVLLRTCIGSMNLAAAGLRHSRGPRFVESKSFAIRDSELFRVSDFGFRDLIPCT